MCVLRCIVCIFQSAVLALFHRITGIWGHNNLEYAWWIKELKNLICSIIEHKYDQTFSIEYLKGFNKDVMIFCIRCDHKIDLSKFYDWSELKNATGDKKNWVLKDLKVSYWLVCEKWRILRGESLSMVELFVITEFIDYKVRKNHMPSLIACLTYHAVRGFNHWQKKILKEKRNVPSVEKCMTAKTDVAECVIV